MTLGEAQHKLHKLHQKLKAIKLLEMLLLSFSIGIVLIAILQYPFELMPSVICAAIASASFFIYQFSQNKLWTYPAEKIIRRLNEQFIELEDSADLLHEHKKLSKLQQIQQQKTIERFDTIQNNIHLPNNLIKYSLYLATSVMILFVSTIWLSNYKTNRGQQQTDLSTNKNAEVIKVKVPASIRDINIEVSPPAYTRMNKSSTNNPNIVAAEGSIIRWAISFSDSIGQVELIFAGKENLILNGTRLTYSGKATISTSTFYQIRWTNKQGIVKSSDYFKIEITLDRPPVVEIINLRQSLELNIKDKLQIEINTQAHDDYGLKDGYLIATVSKGSGESVKFREEKLNFTSPTVIHGKSVRASRTIDLLKLGMEPGDELYLYAEFHDNKQPLENNTRTETYFITVQDTASQFLSIESGLGVDLMPDYFRSQRQIIIDTEKLLKEKSKILRQVFNSTSNGLGYDQKVLRLKYGEFLGEEFETRIGETEPQEADESTEDITKKYTHAHDTENEHNLVDSKKTGPQHDHADENGEGEKSLVDAYKHQHDDTEEATFFNQSIRAKLKAALTEMWDAELYLRLYEPEKSLPYQYKALKLLKEVSNDSRIYVHKTGFDAPPVKEDKRLSGDVTEIKTSRTQQELKTPITYPAIRKAINVVEDKLISSEAKFSSKEKQTLHSAGIELAPLAIERPAIFLNSLTLIKSLVAEDISPPAIKSSLASLRKSLSLALPNTKTTPTSKSQTAHSLDQTFLKNIDSLNND